MTSHSLAELERRACFPDPIQLQHFNPRAIIPYGLTIEHLQASMQAFLDFIGFINQQLASRQIERLETMLMPANFSSIVGEFQTSTIPKHCPGLTKNGWHNGHPDLVPTGHYPGNAVQHDIHGIEVKGSRYLRGWQGHNAEDAWLMVFCFESGRPTDGTNKVLPAPFRFLAVFGAQLEKSDWTFSGRSETSRRTITASVSNSGYQKMTGNWIYKVPGLKA